jgi:hypothetical protein
VPDQSRHEFDSIPQPCERQTASQADEADKNRSLPSLFPEKEIPETVNIHGPMLQHQQSNCQQRETPVHA